MQKHVIALCLLLAVLSTFLISPLFADDVSLSVKSPARTCFSPNGGCNDLALKAITQARIEILIMAYSFRSISVAQALIAAHRRGVKVEVVLDKSERQEGFTPATMMANADIPVYLDGIHAVMNNRIIIIDRKIIMTGSFSINTASEEMNAENLLFLRSDELAKLYRDNWFNHRKHSEKY
ncbi:MAG TPA: phospholipase D-like domain-containing protein [Smithellaceae bacterium]|nr:phospholipase D-like domain-containing protein [Smithellaceae bacterium]